MSCKESTFKKWRIRRSIDFNGFIYLTAFVDKKIKKCSSEFRTITVERRILRKLRGILSIHVFCHLLSNLPCNISFKKRFSRGMKMNILFVSCHINRRHFGWQMHYVTEYYCYLLLLLLLPLLLLFDISLIAIFLHSKFLDSVIHVYAYENPIQKKTRKMYENQRDDKKILVWTHNWIL